MDSEYSATYHEVESRHWWFAVRRKILQRLISHQLKKMGKVKFQRTLEIGCFAGKNIEYLRELSSEWVGIEPSADASAYAKKILPDVTVITGNFPEVTATGTFDAILLFDVLEHIENPVQALREIERLLDPGGLVIITVPAYQWLWTRFDEINEHHRRYTSSLLSQQLQSAHLISVRIGYYNTLLFIPAVVERLWSKYMHKDTQVEKIDIPAAPLNDLLKIIFSLEASVVPWLFFPYGVSVVSVSRSSNERQNLQKTNDYAKIDS